MQPKTMNERLLFQIPTPSPSSIFIRESAIIFNIESLRMIITKDEVSSSANQPRRFLMVSSLPRYSTTCALENGPSRSQFQKVLVMGRSSMHVCTGEIDVGSACVSMQAP